MSTEKSTFGVARDTIHAGMKDLKSALPKTYGRVLFGEISFVAEYVAETEADIAAQVALDLLDLQNSEISVGDDVTHSILSTYREGDEVISDVLFRFTSIPRTDSVQAVIDFIYADAEKIGCEEDNCCTPEVQRWFCDDCLDELEGEGDLCEECFDSWADPDDPDYCEECGGRCTYEGDEVGEEDPFVDDERCDECGDVTPWEECNCEIFRVRIF